MDCHKCMTRTLCRRCPLRKQCLPANLNSSNLVEFERSVHSINIPKKRILVRSGERANSVFAVRSGVLKGLASTSLGMGTMMKIFGVEHIVTFMYPGDLAGLAATSGRWPGSLVALQDASLCQIPNSAIMSHGLLRRLIRLTGDRLQDVYRLHVALATYSSSKRLAMFLMNAGYGLGETPPTMDFYLPMSQSDIANYLGLRTESVNRAFKQLRHRGLITQRQKNVHIRSTKAMRELIKKDDSK